jgi:8-oxo-dGTP pyrophosphatase MutT (NUDIX family)
VTTTLENRDTRVQIVIIENGRYILLKHLAIRENRTFWGLPGGGRELGESDEVAALREAKEETGLTLRLLPVKTEIVLPKKRILYHRIVTFAAFPLSGEARTGSEPEAATVADYNYRLIDLKWQPFYDDAGLEPFTIDSLQPTRTALAEAPIRHKAGALVTRKHEGRPQCLLISAHKDPQVWVLPQGYLEDGETAEAAAWRETREEAGLEVELHEHLGFDYSETDSRFSRTDFFLATPLRNVTTSENRHLKWVDIDTYHHLQIPRACRKLLEAHWQTPPTLDPTVDIPDASSNCRCTIDQ